MIVFAWIGTIAALLALCVLGYLALGPLVLIANHLGGIRRALEDRRDARPSAAAPASSKRSPSPAPRASDRGRLRLVDEDTLPSGIPPPANGR